MDTQLTVGDAKTIAEADQEQQLQPMRLLDEQMRVLQAENAHSPLEFRQLLDLLNYLPGSVLAKADRESKWIGDSKHNHHF